MPPAPKHPWASGEPQTQALAHQHTQAIQHLHQLQVHQHHMPRPLRPVPMPVHLPLVPWTGRLQDHMATVTGVHQVRWRRRRLVRDILRRREVAMGCLRLLVQGMKMMDRDMSNFRFRKPYGAEKQSISCMLGIHVALGLLSRIPCIKGAWY